MCFHHDTYSYFFSMMDFWNGRRLEIIIIPPNKENEYDWLKIHL